MLNINYGHNRELMQKCRRLEEYALFISKVREHTSSAPNNLSEAIERAVDECIEEGILADILSTQKAEVLELALTTFDRELYERGLREEGEAIGEARGKVKGEEKLSKLIHLLLDAGLADAVRVVTMDKEAREEYYKKYNIE